jgi:4a-hydroxytetrahydrobiopterin dehydratase
VARKKLSAEELVEKLSEATGWERKGGKIYKRFTFKNFIEPLKFVNQVGKIAERLDHHPDISFGWGYAEFSITTHDAGGLTMNDFELAKQIDEI